MNPLRFVRSRSRLILTALSLIPSLAATLPADATAARFPRNVWVEKFGYDR